MNAHAPTAAIHEDSHLPAREVREASRTLLEAALAVPTPDALMRAVAAAAIDPAGLGGEVAHALRWDAVTGLFELVARTSVAPEGVIERRPEPRLAAWELDASMRPCARHGSRERATTFARVAGANRGDAVDRRLVRRRSRANAHARCRAGRRRARPVTPMARRTASRRSARG
jgi:hypothetical protein